MSAPLIFTANDCLDFGIDLGSPVGLEYYDQAPFKFYGKIEDISTKAGPKAIIDASDRGIVNRIRDMTDEQRSGVLRVLQQSLAPEEINILLGRKQGLAEYEEHMHLLDWSEVQWQEFFDREQWVFGYGIDYRMMRQFDREMTVGAEAPTIRTSQ